MSTRPPCGDPALMQRLDCLAASVQEEMVASRNYWEELRAEMAAQRARRPACARVVRRSQCLHRGCCKLLAHAWQTRACDPSTGPACAGMLRDTVSRACRDCFSEPARDSCGDWTAAALRPAAAESCADFDNNTG